jgi:SLAP domain-containing protein
MKRLLIISFLCGCVIAGCSGSSSKKEPQTTVKTLPTNIPKSTVLDFQTVQINDSANRVHVKTKIRSIAKRHIRNAEATCTLMDVNRNKLASEKHYVISSFRGGLAPKDSTDFTFVFNTDMSRIDSISYHVGAVNYR